MNFKIYFMRKRLLFLLPYLICVIAGWGLGYCVFEVDRDKAKQQATKIITNEGEVYEKLYFKRSAEYGYVPEECVLRRSDGLIPDAKTALKVGTTILLKINENTGTFYDKYTVKLINETVWVVSISAGRGGASVYLQKSDGRILYLFFWK